MPLSVILLIESSAETPTDVFCLKLYLTTSTIVFASLYFINGICSVLIIVFYFIIHCLIVVLQTWE